MREHEEICKDYTQSFLTFQQLAKKYHRGTDAIRQILKNNNIHLLSSAERAILKRNEYKYTYEEIEKSVLEEYCVNHKGLSASGKKFNLSQENVKTILKKNNIPIRNFSEAAILSNQNRAYSKEESYFSVESHNMAWILGFIASDGNVSKKDNRIKISLSYIDREILEKIKEEVKIENEIKDAETNKGFLTSTLSWSSKQHKDDLKKYNIVPNKTFILKPPTILDRRFWIDYIRGYFDGDGSVSYQRNNSGKIEACRFQICSATKEVLEWMINYFYEEHNIPKPKIYTQQRVHDLYYFQYSTRATLKIHSVLYNNSLCLSRKKKKYDEIATYFNANPRDSATP